MVIKSVDCCGTRAFASNESHYIWNSSRCCFALRVNLRAKISSQPNDWCVYANNADHSEKKTIAWNAENPIILGQNGTKHTHTHTSHIEKL